MKYMYVDLREHTQYLDDMEHNYALCSVASNIKTSYLCYTAFTFRSRQQKPLDNSCDGVSFD